MEESVTYGPGTATEEPKPQLDRLRGMGLEPLLTVGDLALLMGKKRRYVMGLIRRGTIRAAKYGGNSWRTDRAEWERFKRSTMESGSVAGFRHAKASGGIRKGMRGYKDGGAHGNGVSGRAIAQAV